MNKLSRIEAHNQCARWLKSLGLRTNSEPKFLTSFTPEKLPSIFENKEKRVIEQDCLRTRTINPFFNSSRIHSLLLNTILIWSFHYDIRYMQGIHEILAVILSLSKEYNMDTNNSDCESYSTINNEIFAHDESYSSISSLLKPFLLPLAIFEKFMHLLTPAIFSTLGLDALQSQIVSFHSLLFYFEPDIARHIAKSGFSSDMYVQGFLICLFSQRQEITNARHIFELLISKKNCPFLIIFMCLALMKIKKNELLSLSIDLIPQALVRLNFTSIDEVDKAYEVACQLMSSTPASVIKEMQSLGFDSRNVSDEMRAVGLVDLMYRPCVSLNFQDIAKSGEGSNYSFVVLDIRFKEFDTAPLAFPIDRVIKVPHSICLEIIKGSNTKNVQGFSSHTASFILFLKSLKDKNIHIAIASSENQAFSCSVNDSSIAFCSNPPAAASSNTPISQENCQNASTSNPNQLKKQHQDEEDQNQRQQQEAWGGSEHGTEILELMRSNKTRCKQNLQLLSRQFASALILLSVPLVSIVTGRFDCGNTGNTSTKMPKTIIDNEVSMVNADFLGLRLVQAMSSVVPSSKFSTAESNDSCRGAGVFSNYFQNLSSKLNISVFDDASKVATKAAIGSIDMCSSSGAPPASPTASSSIGSNMYSTKQFFNVMSTMSAELEKLDIRINAVASSVKAVREKRTKDRDKLQEIQDKEEYLFVKFP